VVRDVGFADTVKDVSSDRTHEGTVDGGEGASGEGPFVGGVVGKDGVGVLQEGDQDEPVVDPKVRDQVHVGDLSESALVAPEPANSKSSGNTNVRQDDLPFVGRLEDDSGWGKVVGAGWVVELTRSVVNQVHGPTEELTNKQVDKDGKRCISDSLTKFLLTGFGYVKTSSFTFFLHLWVTALRPSSGDENFIPGKMVGCGVVASVRDSPRVVRNQQERMKDQSCKVIDKLG